MRKFTLMAAAAVAALGVAASPALAEFPKDGNVTWIIPYGPGGGFDTVVRTFAGPLEKALGTTVVPKNVPGASGNRGGQTVMRADPDGYTIGIFNVPGVTVSQAIGRDIGYDLNKVTWIANLAEGTYAIAVKADSKINSIKDLCGLGRPAKLSDTGLDSTSSIAARIALHILDCPMTPITGYSGSNATMIAVMRGEVDATLKPISSLNKYVKSGDLKYIFTLTKEPAIKGVQDAADIGHPELAKFTINRVVGGPPGMSPAVVKTLADGLKQASESKQVQDWAKSSGADIVFKGPEETQQMMQDLSSFYGKYKTLLSSK